MSNEREVLRACLDVVSDGALEPYCRYKSSFPQPTVIDGAANDWPARRLWDFDYLTRRLGHLDVLVVPGTSGFPIGDAIVPPDPVAMPMSTYIDTLRPGAASGEQAYLFERSLVGDASALLPDVRIPQLVPSVHELIEANVWLGPPGNLTPLHYDQMHNVLAQIRGSKEIVLMAPHDLGSAYVGPVNSERDRRSRVNVSDPDPEAFPRFLTATRWRTVLDPGDILFIPAYWFHEVRTVSTSISVNFWWRPPIDHCAVPGLSRYLKRDGVFGELAMIRRAVGYGDRGELHAARRLLKLGDAESGVLLAGSALLTHLKAGARFGKERSNEGDRAASALQGVDRVRHGASCTLDEAQHLLTAIETVLLAGEDGAARTPLRIWKDAPTDMSTTVITDGRSDAGLARPRRLEPLIDPRHLTPEVQHEYRSAFARSREGGFGALAIPNFLRADVADRVANLLTSPAVTYSPSYGLYGEAKEVPENTWLEAHETDRFYHYDTARSLTTGEASLPSVVTLVALQQALVSHSGCDFVCVVTGADVAPGHQFSVHRMARSHFLRIHTDTIFGRRMAAVLNFTKGWRKEFGGTLHLVSADGKRRQSYPPNWNTLVLFDLEGVAHYVDPIDGLAREHVRLSLGGWYADASAGSAGRSLTDGDRERCQAMRIRDLANRAP